MQTYLFLRGRSAGAWNKFCSIFLTSAIAFGIVGLPSTVFSQATVLQRIDDHLSSGEFPVALKLAEELSGSQSDLAFRKIAAAQFAGGAQPSAFESAAQINNDLERADVLTAFANYGTGPGYTSGSGGTGLGGPGFGGSGSAQAGAQGGITEADFEPLIELIKSTINKDGWEDTNGDGTIQAYPSGVYVDSQGLLKKLRVDKSTKSSLRANARIDSGNRKSYFPSELRKVSLTRLEKAAQLAAAQGKGVNADMANLAGIYEIEYLMFFPDTNDIVIAGPAGPWYEDVEGRLVNRDTGKPVLKLDDLVVCLRNAWGNNGKFGCAITPRQKNLAQTKKVLGESKLKGKAWRELLQKTLGRQDVEVFGVDPRTHTGRVLVEADYRMKLVGMGLEKSIPEVPSYLKRIELLPDGSLPPMDVVRWWFTLNYDDVTADEAREVFTFAGTGVKVLSENEMLDDVGNRIHTGQSKGPTREFARDFTEHFEEIASVYPVYNQLKNVFDMALVASLIRHQDLAEKAEWHLTYFGKPKAGRLTHELELEPVATEVDSVINHRVINQRTKSSLKKHTIVGVSGGIRFDAHEAISTELLKTDGNGALDEQAQQARPNEDSTWWWD